MELHSTETFTRFADRDLVAFVGAELSRGSLTREPKLCTLGFQLPNMNHGLGIRGGLDGLYGLVSRAHEHSGKVQNGIHSAILSLGVALKEWPGVEVVKQGSNVRPVLFIPRSTEQLYAHDSYIRVEKILIEGQYRIGHLRLLVHFDHEGLHGSLPKPPVVA